MTSNAQQPQDSPSSVSDLPELSFESFPSVMETVDDFLNIVVTVIVGGEEKEYEVLLGNKATRYSDGDVHYQVRSVGIWRLAGETKTSAQFMSAVGVSPTSEFLLFLDDDGRRIPRASLVFTAVKWLDELVIDIPDDLLK